PTIYPPLGIAPHLHPKVLAHFDIIKSAFCMALMWFSCPSISARLPINENTCQPLYGTLFFGEQARITLPVRILLPTTRAKLINSTITL
ncbi:hypothetical protein, partial [Brucella melitensis]